MKDESQINIRQDKLFWFYHDDITGILKDDFDHACSIREDEGSVFFSGLGSYDTPRKYRNVCPMKWLSDKLGKTIVALSIMTDENDKMIIVCKVQ
jgi:hypothetical protein